MVSSTSTQSPNKSFFFQEFLYKYLDFSKHRNNVSNCLKIMKLTSKFRDMRKVFPYYKIDFLALTLSLLERPKAANRKWPITPRMAKSGQLNIPIFNYPLFPQRSFVSQNNSCIATTTLGQSNSLNCAYDLYSHVE